MVFTRRASIWLLLISCLAIPANSEEQRGPFTAPPHSVRDRTFDLLHVRIELDLDWEQEVVQAKTTTRLTPFAKIEALRFDAVGLDIKNVSLVSAGSADEATDESSAGHRSLEFETLPESLIVRLDQPYDETTELTIEIEYRIEKPKRGFYFINPDENEPQQAQMAWTQCQPSDARYWFPTFDSPNERCTSEIIATVPASYYVLSNGVLRSSEVVEGDRKRWHWVQEQSHSPYLFSVVAGEFEALEQSYRSIPIISYVPKGRMEEAERSFGQTPEMMELFCEMIGYRYPWPKYAQICVDEYVAGGMEHTSATTLTTRTLHDARAELDVSSEGLVAHELAHQWWGDLLTCKDWGELWLNESFATYFASLWKEHDDGWEEATWTRYREAESYFNEDTNRYRRSIVNYRFKNPSAMFDRHSYPKGARVLHMLRNELGDDAFWAALRHYALSHEYGVVETADLRTAIEQSSGRGMNWFFDQWIHHGGHPEFEVAYRWDSDEQLVRLTVRQTQAVTDLTPLFRVPVEIELVTPEETITRKITIAKADETFSFSVSQRPKRVVFDPQDWILKKLSFTKSKQEWIDQLAHDEHVVPRVRAAGQLGEFKPDADARDALIAVAAGDAFWAVRQEAVKTLSSFGGEPARAGLILSANSDAKSAVRREAVKALGEYPSDESAACLRSVIAEDQSYYAIAAAITSLVKIAGDDAKGDLAKAMEMSSHNEVILRAACDGLAELDDKSALDQLLSILEPPSQPQRRQAVFSALAKLGDGQERITTALAEQLDDERRSVRYSAMVALGETGDAAAIEILLRQRGKERSQRVQRVIDDAVKKLRDDSPVDKLREEIDTLRKTNQNLEQRLKTLEEDR